MSSRLERAGFAALAVPWLAGTLLVHELPSLPGPAWYVPLGLAALLALRSPRTRWLIWAAAAFAWTAHRADARLAERLPEASLGADVALAGWVDGFPSASRGQTTFSFRVDPPIDGIPRRVRLTWYRPPAPLAAGTSLSLVARLRPPRGLVNPRGFDYERWLFTERYGATGYVRSGEARRAPAGGLPGAWLRFRAEIARRIGASVPDADAAALITALAIGERFRFSERHWEELRRTGTSHLVAISGMHVGLIAALVFLAVRRLWVWLPHWLAVHDIEAAALASAAAAAWYAALAGFAVPTQRSLLMILVALAMLASRVPASPANGLAAASLVVLVWDPFAPLGASFWLSFAAVGLLLLLCGERRLRQSSARSSRASGALRAARATARLQWGMSLGLAPLVAALFAGVSIVSPLVNLVAIPFFCFVLVPAALLATLALPIGAAGSVLMHWAGLAASGAWAVIGALAGLPWAAIGIPPPAPWAVPLACFGALLGVAARPLPGHRLAWLAVLPLLAPAPKRLPPDAFKAVVLDVGHGLAALVETRAHRLLFDAGPSYPSGFDAGREIVLPALSSGRLDVVVVSHADNDHAGGAAAVLAAFPAAQVLKGPDIAELPGRICERGQHWIWDGVAFDILHPPARFAPLGNETSCVLKISTSGGALLLTGDIERRGEQTLAATGALGASAVVVPHHGSATSSSSRFVTGTRAALALVSAGYANRWGFPKPEVRGRWERAGARVLVTGESGALTLELEGSRLAVTTERERRRRYWSAKAAP